MTRDTGRRVVLYQLLSLDGVAEEPSDYWLDGGEEMFANLARVIAPQTDVLLGRVMYDEWADTWPDSDMQPFADFINGVPKHVVGSPSRTWEGTVRVEGPVEQHVRRLKGTEGGDIGVHGSITLAQSLLSAGLVDRLSLAVAPTVAGTGRRLLDGQGLTRWALVRSATSPEGSLFLDYDLSNRS
ncbi:dihydrofolate reductase family protein [Nocardioides aequoreus]|uniref:dihydrofolate reductase family protein n=1 Tax=Nocardioides aequoreus TaxID=397278 RepID=UPI0004C31F18|nr:dihydrofolate reductase family protein [Nocardioides aequoreus]